MPMLLKSVRRMSSVLTPVFVTYKGYHVKLFISFQAATETFQDRKIVLLKSI